MGSAMLHGWANNSTIQSISVVDPHAGEEFTPFPKIQFYKDISALRSTEFDAVIFAVKPQMMHEVCTTLSSKIKQDTLIISIAAGKTIASFTDIFDEQQPVIRTMPNTPAAIGKGITALCANKNVSKEQNTLAQALLSVTGKIVTAEEAHFNAITALSGSGPAYLFHMIEMLERAGTELGLPSGLAQKLARQTIIGSAALAEAEPNISAATLRQNVTSPNGTTAAALNILMNGEMQGIYTKALKTAKKRGEELNNQPAN